MKKLLLFGLGIVSCSFFNSQNYLGSEFIGNSGFNYPLGFSNNATSNKTVMYGYIGGGLTDSFPIAFAGGNFDGALTSIDPSTGAIQWIKTFGGGADEVVMDAAIDNAGNYYLTGYMMSSGAIALDADPGPNVYPLSVVSTAANRDIFIIKLDSSGNFVWAKKMCSPDTSAANDDVATIALDSRGNIYLAGSYVYLNFDTGTHPDIYTASGSADGFLTKLDSDGNLAWVKTLQGSASSFTKITEIVIDENDNIYTTGRFNGSFDINPDPTVTDTRTSFGVYDTFVAKYTVDGEYVWGLNYGGASTDLSEGIALNGNNVYVSGNFSGTVDLDPTTGTNLATSSYQAGYFSSFTKDGAYNTSFVIPDSYNVSETAKDIYFDANNNIYIAGMFGNMTVGGNTYTGASSTNADNYYLKLDPTMSFSGIYLVKGVQNQGGPYITGYGTNKFIIAGACKGAAAFDYTNPSTTTTYSSAQFYTYLTKIDFDATVLSTSDVANKNKITVYPNPAKSEVFLNSNTKINSVSIFNMEGRQVFTQKANNIKSLNISILPNGNYILQSVDENGKAAQTKLIKQ